MNAGQLKRYAAGHKRGAARCTVGPLEKVKVLSGQESTAENGRGKQLVHAPATEARVSHPVSSESARNELVETHTVI